MCDPVSIAVASVAVGTVSSVMAHDSQRRAGNQQMQGIRENYAANDGALQVQQGQIDRQASGQASERARQALKERGHMIAAFSSSGVNGNSQARALNESELTESTDLATIESNRSDNAGQNARQRAALARGANAEAASIKMPTLIGTGLQIAGHALNAGGSYYASQPRPARAT